MATRTIVTSHPDVACDVCERRLLRGEQPDIFLAAGRRRTVCELCAPRAAHEGWMRERDSQSVTLPPLRPRRGRSFLDRLRQGARAAEAEQPAPAPADELDGEAYDFLDGYGGRARATPVAAATGDEGGPHAAEPEPAPRSATYSELAVEVFNASEFPRRIAGVARSLGAPEVTVRVAEHHASVITIVIAWELCWYRYEVDLGEEPPEARVSAQGTELGELAREDREVNALASDAGLLALAA